MKLYVVKFGKRFVVILLAAFFSIATFGFKILDPGSYNVFLRMIAASLDSNGIDVVQDWNSNVILEGRPTLAPIANYNASVLDKQDKWMQAYISLYANAIVALDTKESVTASTFITKWNSAPTEKRIFISFTKDDLSHAERIKTVLSTFGYKVFLYTESHRAPFTSIDMIVYCMKTAGEVLVLDTENARNKAGIFAETVAFAKYSYKPTHQLIAENRLLKEQIQEAVKKTSFSLPNSEEVIGNAMKYFNLPKKSTLAKMKNEYKIDTKIYFSTDFIENGKQKYLDYLLNSDQLTPYAYNKKLTENLNFLNENPVINILTVGTRLLTFFGFCPYYRIPIVLCSKCSNALTQKVTSVNN